MDPAPPSSAPTDARRRVRDAFATARRADVTGLAGAARGLLVQDLLAPGPGRARAVLCVAADEEEADRLAKDAAFFVGTDAVLRLPADAVLPYDDLSPDRGVEMERLAALARLHLQPEAIRAIVVSARGFARRAVPTSLFSRGTDLLGQGLQVDREVLARRLVELGFARVPLVEDPGTFAVRGGVVDVWSPAERLPCRLEFFGDEVESCRRFEPQTQRSEQEPAEVLVCPAREALFGEAARTAAKEAIRTLAEQVNRPTSRVRELLDAIDTGAPFFGLEALLPAFHPGGLVPLFDHLPPETVAWVDDAAAVDEAIEGLWVELAREHAAALAREELALPPDAHYLTVEAARERLDTLRGVRRHAVWLGTGEPVRLSLGDTAALRGEIEAAHGDEGALAPLTRRLEDWRKRGLTAVVACGSPSTVDRLRRLLEDRRQVARTHA